MLPEMAFRNMERAENVTVSFFENIVNKLEKLYKFNKNRRKIKN